MSYVIKKGDEYYTIGGGIWTTNPYVALEFDHPEWAQAQIDALAPHDDMTGAEIVETPAFVQPPLYPGDFDPGLIK
jgi:hypothetical protein